MMHIALSRTYCIIYNAYLISPIILLPYDPYAIFPTLRNAQFITDGDWITF